ncbi:MAG: hypothetical protein KF773_24400 [Deltaproteobacteria bacterium]|nr:hypothetical protein [Deltaproteobacteria bacterium]
MPRIALATALLLAASAAAARADATQEAAKHVEAASAAHGAGNFAAARLELIAAYALDPQPDLLFALGQVHVKLGICPIAVVLYERFLTTKPAEGPRAAATEAIAMCRAQPPAVAAPTPAERLERATGLHRDGKYADALPELMLAYALDPRPEVLYAIGQVEVKLGHCPRAVLFYERFLGTSPPEGAADAATEAIEICRTSPPPVATEPKPPVVVATGRAPWYTDKLGDALAGGALALGIGAAVAYGAARGALADADGAATYDAHAAAVDRAHDRRSLALGLGVGAAALGTVAVYRFLTADRTETRAITLTPTAGGAAVFLGGRW